MNACGETEKIMNYLGALVCACACVGRKMARIVHLHKNLALLHHDMAFLAISRDVCKNDSNVKFSCLFLNISQTLFQFSFIL